MRSRLLSLLVLLLAACDRGDVPRPSSNTPVILISIDTLRSDHLPAYGYKGVSTPNIDALRADSILYQRAYSHCPLTVPSHATVLTGQLPAETGMRDNTGYSLNPASATLAELLAAKGYATGAAVSSYVLHKGTGMERGFAAYDDEIQDRGGLAMSAMQRAGADTVAAAEKWLGANGGKPLFYFLHLYEPHTPYAAPEPYRSRYAPYDAEIAQADEVVGRFLQRLKDAGIYDNALIVLFSDHGEGLGDHGEDEHGIFLYREALQVPLMVKLPGAAQAGNSVDRPVQLSDIFPTVLAQTGIKHDARSTSGARSLLDDPDAKTAERQIYSETYFPRFHFGWSDLHSLMGAQHHYIHAPQPELYETSDVAEKNNVLNDNRRVYAAMRRSIEPAIRMAEAPKAVSPEEAAKLAALGYLGSTAAVEGPLPDPKTKTQTFREIREAFKLFQAGNYEAALTYYQRLLRENPRMLDLWEISARALVRLGRRAEAIDAAKEALKISPQSTHLALLIANLSLEQGQADTARQHAELALKSHPVEAREILARAALASGDVSAAEREARSALAAEPKNARALMTLGRIEKDKQNLGLALTHLEAATEAARNEQTALSGLHYMRGDVLARLGRAQEAEQALREEIRLFPEDAPAYMSLILLYVSAGRVDEGTRLIHELEKASPTPPSYAAISNTLRVIGDQRGARFWAVRGLRRFPNDQTLRRLAG
ncbi:MAG TPA: sulfatase-like hydrolase/transferase [Thermoanaerobaculia bacterium]|nr:sulfatase-like hydrolase/transferase [Thermoanaerobaculia bacterium]